MTFILKRVELSNIRSHEHFIFEPEETGMTAISGHNGAGKSTIVDSLAWCTFGTKPNGVSKAISILKYGKTIGKDKCFVRLDALIDGRDIRIERRIVSKVGAVECEVFELIKNKWVTIAGPTVTAAEPVIRKLLKMDERGFLASILIQQKQVDQLIVAAPKERREVIEKLTGISSVTAAINEARGELNGLKKLSNHASVDENLLKELKVRLKTNEEYLSSFQADNEKMESSEKSLRELGINLRKEVEHEQKKITDSINTKTRLSALAATLEAKESEFQRLIAEKEAKKKRLSGNVSSSSAKEITEKIEILNDEISALSESIFNVKNELLRDSEERDRLTSIISGDKSSLEESTEKLNSLEKLLVKNKNDREKIILAHSHAGNQVDGLEKAIEIIESGGACPTCLQIVKDSDLALKSLHSQQNDFEIEFNEKEIEKSEITTHIEAYENEIDLFKEIIAAKERMPGVVKNIQKLEKLLPVKNGELKTLKNELVSLEKVNAQLKAQDSLKVEYEEVLKIAMRVGDEIEVSKKEVISLKNLNHSPISDAAFKRLTEKLDKARAEFMTLTGKLATVKGEIKLYEEKIKNDKLQIEQQELEAQKHKELLKNIEILSNSASVLEEFRINRIENSIPTLEGHASELLSRFTEGKFTQFKLDGNFVASVVLANGAERAVGLLSGGELSAAAIALRLAISMMLNSGGSNNLLVLDEVLVSQDATRAELILSSIKELTSGQIVMIAHNDYLSDSADKIVELN